MTGLLRLSRGGKAGDEEKTASGRRFNHAVKWNAASKLATRFMQFFVTVALARLLLPRDFGLYGMTSMVTGLVMFAEFGFAYALIQKLPVTDDDICTALSMSVLLGTTVTGLCLLAAPLVAAVFHEPAVTLPLRAASLGMFIVAFAITPRALLGRRMDFRSIAMADMTGPSPTASSRVGLAAAGAGIWSLVVGGLAMALAQAVMLWRRASYRFRRSCRERASTHSSRSARGCSRRTSSTSCAATSTTSSSAEASVRRRWESTRSRSRRRTSRGSGWPRSWGTWRCPPCPRSRSTTRSCVPSTGERSP